MDAAHPPVTDAPYFLTTAIAYPNGNPHIGHAYEYVTADVLARFHRLAGRDVFFMTGTDEHGLKMQQTAMKEGVTTRELAGRNAATFKAAHERLGSSFDRFIRTTDLDHYTASQAMWQLMADAGDIYLDKYAGWYSVRDEAYYTEDETEVCDGVRRAIATHTPVEWTEEESYFFRLSKYQDKLLALYEQKPTFFQPQTRLNEIKSFVAGGLSDLSISRTTFDWGVPVPGDERHVMYVWVDALTNYLTGAGFPHVDGERFQKYWPPNLQVIGKDITRFHAVYWPAFLMSAGLELPERIFAHGFLNVKGEKMSKSVGNVINPNDLINEFGLDAVRYFLCREVSFGQDGNYSVDAIIGRINADLANEYGNLAQRSLSMISKNCGAVMPTPGEFSDEDNALLHTARALPAQVLADIDTQALHVALGRMWSVLGDTNKYFSSQEPWVLRKTNPDRMGTVLYVTAEVVRIVTILAQPYMPDSTSALLDLLGVDKADRDLAAIASPLVPGTPLPTPRGIFPRYAAPTVD